MNQMDMLQRMCHGVLSGGDTKAIAKARGFPAAATNPGILTGLFLTEQGVADSLKALSRDEVSALHMLKAVGKPVDISFFGRLYGNRGEYGYTFTQRYQGVLAKVKERLVRTGIVLMCDVQGREGETKMELWRFALPVQFHLQLPPLVDAPRTFDGAGTSGPAAVREKLLADLKATDSAVAAKKADDVPRFDITGGEVRLGGSPFRAAQIVPLQLALWNQILSPKKGNANGAHDEDSLEPPNAVYQALASLDEDQWAAAAQINDCVRVFAGRKVDCDAACEAGWQVGMLAQHKADGMTWYRLAPAEPVVAPQHYLDVVDDGQFVTVDLNHVPFASLEKLVHVGDVRRHPSGATLLLLAPNLVRIGRTGDDVLASEELNWLFHHSRAFAQAQDLLASRRGKTVLHNNVLIARVTDLSLKVALQKLLGDRCLALKNDYVVFPRGALGDVQRTVKKMGHVIKEVSSHEG